MAAKLMVGALAMASLAMGIAPRSPPGYDPIHTHTVQFNMDLIEEEFVKAGYQSTIEFVKPFAAVDAYAGPTSYGDRAINAPINCLNQNTHIGCFTYMDGTFDANRCADQCTNKTIYNLAHGLADRPCRFFNTYVLNKNGAPFSQYCSLVIRIPNSQPKSKN